MKQKGRSRAGRIGGAVPGRRRTVVIPISVLVAVGAAALVYSTTRDHGPAGGSPSAKYCELSAKLSGLLAGAGVPPAGPVPASVRPEAIQKVLDQMGGQINDLEGAAPSAVHGDVTIVIRSLKQAGRGDLTGVQSPSFVAAERSVAGVLQTCRASAPGGEGPTG